MPSVVLVIEAAAATGSRPLMITADRILRERLPVGSLVSGPRALLDLLDGGPR